MRLSLLHRAHDAQATGRQAGREGQAQRRRRSVRLAPDRLAVEVDVARTGDFAKFQQEDMTRSQKIITEGNIRVD